MKKTSLIIKGSKFLINNKLTYNEIEGCSYQGLLMNARFIQGVFDDKAGRERFHRFGRRFDPQENTELLLHALPTWYEAGIRAVTVGFQGGGPCFTIDNTTIENNPYGSDGKQIDTAYLERMGRIIDEADRIGMVIIVSLFYGSQTRFL